MKQVLAIGAALILLGLPAAARAQPPAVGLRAGINAADLSVSPTPTPEPGTLTGFTAGLFVTVPVSPLVAFQPEVLYSQQGTRFSQGGMTAKVHVDYLQVPLLGRFALGKTAPVAVLVGPTLGIRTHASFKADGVPDEFSQDFEDQLERFDLGLTTGVAADIGRLVLDGRYTWGLLNIAKDSGDDTVKHRVLSFTAGVRF